MVAAQPLTKQRTLIAEKKERKKAVFGSMQIHLSTVNNK
jgi:hypothetical protein